MVVRVDMGELLGVGTGVFRAGIRNGGSGGWSRAGASFVGCGRRAERRPALRYDSGMFPLDERVSERIRGLCREHRVATLYAVGSAATGEFDPAHSDFDFLVEFEPHQRKGFDDEYFKLLAGLKDLLGRHVDLIERHCVRNPVVKADLERTKVPLYAAA